MQYLWKKSKPRPNGRPRWYFRRGDVLIALPDIPTDDPRFVAAWAQALAEYERAIPAPEKATGGFATLCRSALAHKRTKALSASYRAALRRHVDDLVREFGALPVSGLRDRHIAANVAAADNPGARLKTWRYICAHAVMTGILPTDPSRAVRGPKPEKTDGHEPWTDEDLAAYRARWPIGTAPRAAMELLRWTACRISDGVRIGIGNVGADGVLSFRQQKTGDLAYVPWSCAVPHFAAHIAHERDMMHRALEPFAGHMTFLATWHGRGRSDKALGTLIRDAAAKAGVHKSAHGLRKALAVSLADGGATPHQIAAWTGHQTLKEIERYTKAADRRRAVMGIETLRPKTETR